jgi:hypothetical protein
MKAKLRARLLGGIEQLVEWLGRQEDVSSIETDRNEVAFSYSTDVNQQAALIKRIVHADFELLEFGPRTTSLEDVFLKLTGHSIRD